MDELITTYTEDQLCGHEDPVQQVCDVKSIETRLRILTLGVLYDTFPGTTPWNTLISIGDTPLLDPTHIAYSHSKEVGAMLKQAELGKPAHYGRVWWQICRGIQGRFKGRFTALLAAQDHHALSIQAYLTESSTTFPVLSGPSTSARWLDLIHRVAGIELQGWHALKVDLPEGLGKAARAFDHEQTNAHPVVWYALRAWVTYCQAHPDCALATCPRHPRPSAS